MQFQKKNRLIAALLIAFSIGAIVAEPTLPGDPNAPVSLEDYLRIAALNNAGLKGSFQKWRAETAGAAQAGTLDDPRFTYGYFIEEVETRVGPQRHRVGISQKFPWFGKLQARSDAAAASAKSAYQYYEAKKLDLFKQVKHAYYEYAYLHEAIAIARQNLELLTHFEQVAQVRYRTASTKHPDIIRAQIELAMLADHLSGLENMQEPVVSGLNALLNRPMGEDLPWPSRLEVNLVQLDQGQVVAFISERNPEITAIQNQIAAARHLKRLASKRYYPDVSLGVDWIQTDSARGSNVHDSGKDPIVAMVSFNIPIWGDSYKSAEAQAHAQMQSARRQKEQKELDLAAQATQILYEIEETHRKANLYQQTLLPKAREMLEVSESAYRAGSVDFLNLIDSQRKLLTFELTYQRIITDHLQRQAELEQLTGGDLPIAAELTP